MNRAFKTIILLFLTLIGRGQAYNLGYMPKENLQLNLEKLDSTLKKNLGYNTGMYWNTLWARYYAMNNYKGLRSMYDPNIVRYNLYSEDYPLVLLNGIPLLFYDIGSIQFIKIQSAIITDTLDIGIKDKYSFLAYGVLDIKADISEYASKELNFGSTLMEKYRFRYIYDVSPTGTNSFLDSVLLATTGLTRNQCYNLRIHQYFQHFACADCKPLLYANQIIHGQLPPAPVAVKDTVYYVYVNHGPLEFFDDENWMYNTLRKLKKGIVVASKKTIEQAGDPSRKLSTRVRVDISVE